MSDTQRYFLAIPLPDDVRDHLLAAQPSSVDGIRLIDREELHLTLHFLGELAEAAKDVARSVLRTHTLDAFTITVRGVGTFPETPPYKVIWAGVERGPGLLALHQHVGTALADAIGYQVEQLPYSPHITLARVNGDIPVGYFENYLSENQDLYIPSIRVTHLALYSSRFADDGPRYCEEALFDLV